MAENLPKQQTNVYTVMLIVSFLSMAIATLFLYLELNEYKGEIKVPQQLQAN